MNRIYETVAAALNAAITGTISKVIDFLPNLLGAMLILLFGWIVAKLAEKVLSKILKTIGLDQFAEGRGIMGILHDVGIKRRFSELASRLVYWILLILFLVPALEALKLTYISQLIGNFVSYLPNLIAAILIFLIGMAIAKVLGGSVAASAQGAGLEYAPAVGMFVRYFLSLIVIILSLAQLGVQTSILTNIFTVLIISLGLALALALGLGSRSVVANILAGAFSREHFPVGREVQIQGVKGKIVSVGAVGTSIESEGRQITVPNTLLMENVIE